ncbi:Pre-mRNA-processing protein prp40 [Smittium culicis]|uniref:Pre-mRNA-processing protein prp40 n=1 Tax=Smittium culicis TaxID=133412 RepID=A0A1R1XQM1_9FUNG|nr:Pre-mRNA-processing protein prp40 [Smittium culicis]
MSNWEIHKAADGRVYYYDRDTKKSTWDKPDELKSSEEAQTIWKEYIAPGGKKYWYNSETKETTWDMPQELIDLQKKIDESEILFDLDTLSINNLSEILKDISDSTSKNAESSNTNLVQVSGAPLENNISSLPSPSSLTSKKESEDAFKLLLSHNNVKSDSTWDSAMRSIIEHPLYNCLESVSERKKVFYQYLEEKKEEDTEKIKAKKRNIRQKFFAVLDSLPLTEYSRFKKAELLCINNPAYTIISDINERQSLFDKYMDNYHDILTELRAERHRHYAKEIDKVLNSLEGLSIRSKWLEIKKILLNHPRIVQLINESKLNQIVNEEEYLKVLEDVNKMKGETSKEYVPNNICRRSININDKLELIDLLEAFQAKLMDLEQQHFNKLDEDRVLRIRKERKNREAYKGLLKENLLSASITPVSLWQEFYPLVRHDKRYIDMLGQPGSTPIELFWDHVEELNDKVYSQRKIIEDHLRQQISNQRDLQQSGQEITGAVFKITPLTKLSELQEYLKSPKFINSVHGANNFDSYILPYIHEQLVIKARRREEEEIKRMQRYKRKSLEYLVHTLNNKLDPPLDVDSKWDAEKHRILSIPDFPSQYISEQECEALFESIIEKLKSQASNAPPEPGEYISSSTRKNISRSSSVDSRTSAGGDYSYSKKKSRRAY